MERTNLLENIRDVLISAGFYVSDLYSNRLTGFDIVARRDDSLLIIKALTNIDSLSEDVAKELKTLSFLLKGNPILVGEKNSIENLEEDVVYFRFGINAITLDTLKNHLLEGLPIKVYAAPGGLYVNLDTQELIRLRKERNISLGTFAQTVNISRRTVRMYEEGMNARVEVASRIEELFDESVTTPIDILKYNFRKIFSQPSFQREIENIKELQKEIFQLLSNVGYNIIPMDRCPFEALSQDKEKILLTCVQKYNSRLEKKAEVVGSISKITEKHAVLFTDKEVAKTNIKGTPLIAKKELKKVRDPEDVYNLIIERIID